MNKIPKIIHYCWFGHKPMPRILKSYIKGWHKICPDYKFICWNEGNFNYSKELFTKKEYKMHNWAFVSDYVRLYALYKYGGIYLDTDVEMLKSLNPLLINHMFMGLEDWNSINSGLIFGSVPGNINIRRLLNIYNDIGNKRFISDYYNTVNIITLYFRKYGFKYKDVEQNVNGCTIYPTAYFCPRFYNSNKINISELSYTMHHYFASWINKPINYKVKKHIKESNLLKKIFGPTIYRKLYKNYLFIKFLINKIG